MKMQIALLRDALKAQHSWGADIVRYACEDWIASRRLRWRRDEFANPVDSASWGVDLYLVDPNDAKIAWCERDFCPGKPVYDVRVRGGGRRSFAKQRDAKRWAELEATRLGWWVKR